MNEIWEFFENLNEFVYVADIDSYELLYMNKKTRETYGYHSIEETVGKKCYEVLHNCGAPCTICNNHELKTGYFKERRYYNPLLGRHFALKNTLIEYGKRKCRLELAVDVSVQEWQNSVINGFQNLETLANEGLRIALQAPTPDKSIELILEYVGKALKGARTYIFEKNEKGGDDNTYEWVASGIKPGKDNLQNLPKEVCADWYQNFSENRNIIIEDLEDISQDGSLQYKLLKRQDIHSLAVVPLYDDKEIIGFYGVDNPTGKSLDYASNMLQIMGHFITSSIKRRDLLKELQKMSYCDQLTKLGNRYAMNQFISDMNPDECAGIVYCDITGLKRVNDTKGHKAGDELILRACKNMRKVFDAYGLFRIGGDELLVLCPGIEEKELADRIEQLKEELENDSVVMAIGSVWNKECTPGIEKLISKAEKLMYEDKSAYYKASGIDRRR